MSNPASHQRQRTASLFRNGRNQAVRIPVEFELPGVEVTITEDDGRLIIEPKPGLVAVLESRGPLSSKDQFPDIDDDHLPQREIDL